MGNHSIIQVRRDGTSRLAVVRLKHSIAVLQDGQNEPGGAQWLP